MNNQALADRSNYNSNRGRTWRSADLVPCSAQGSGPGTRTGSRDGHRYHEDDDIRCSPSVVSRRPSNHMDLDGSRVHTANRSNGRSSNHFHQGRPLPGFRRDPGSRPDHTRDRSAAARVSCVSRGTAHSTRLRRAPRMTLHKVARTRHYVEIASLCSRHSRRAPARARQACVSSFPPKDHIRRSAARRDLMRAGRVDTTGIGGIIVKIQQKESAYGRSEALISA
jgi:hypothetical protein